VSYCSRITNVSIQKYMSTPSIATSNIFN
jgi:hypothetical protein